MKYIAIANPRISTIDSGLMGHPSRTVVISCKSTATPPSEMTMIPSDPTNDRRHTDVVQEETPPPEDVHQAYYEEVEQVAPEGPAEGQIRLADDSDGADPCAQFRQGCGGREEHHADETTCQARS